MLNLSMKLYYDWGSQGLGSLFANNTASVKSNLHYNQNEKTAKYLKKHEIIKANK